MKLERKSSWLCVYLKARWSNENNNRNWQKHTRTHLHTGEKSRAYAVKIFFFHPLLPLEYSAFTFCVFFVLFVLLVSFLRFFSVLSSPLHVWACVCYEWLCGFSRSFQRKRKKNLFHIPWAQVKSSTQIAAAHLYNMCWYYSNQANEMWIHICIVYTHVYPYVYIVSYHMLYAAWMCCENKRGKKCNAQPTNYIPRPNVR